VSVCASEVVGREAGSGHQPGCLTSNLRRVAVSVTKDSVEHLAIADDCNNVVSWKFILVGNGKFVWNDNEGYLIGSKGSKVGFRLSIRVTLALVVQSITVYIHIGDEAVCCTGGKANPVTVDS